MSREVARRDVQLLRTIHAPLMSRVSTFIYPHNRIAHLDVLDAVGMAGYRGARIHLSRGFSLASEFNVLSPPQVDAHATRSASGTERLLHQPRRGASAHRAAGCQSRPRSADAASCGSDQQGGPLLDSPREHRRRTGDADAAPRHCGGRLATARCGQMHSAHTGGLLSNARSGALRPCRGAPCSPASELIGASSDAGQRKRNPHSGRLRLDQEVSGRTRSGKQGCLRQDEGRVGSSA